MDLIKKLCLDLPIVFIRGKFRPDPETWQEVTPRKDMSLEVDRIMKYLGDEDYRENTKFIIGVPRDLLIREEDRNYIVYYLPLKKKTYEHYKKRLCRMLTVRERDV